MYHYAIPTAIHKMLFFFNEITLTVRCWNAYMAAAYIRVPVCLRLSGKFQPLQWGRWAHNATAIQSSIFVKSDYPHNLPQLSRLYTRKYTTTFVKNCLEWQHNLLPDFYINNIFYSRANWTNYGTSDEYITQKYRTNNKTAWRNLSSSPSIRHRYEVMVGGNMTHYMKQNYL